MARDRKVTFGCFMGHEQFAPNDLLGQAAVGERAGFDWIWCSDHFHPWFNTDASAGFAWTWMSAALARVPRVKFGTGVTAPYLRYHPGLVAQAFATMGNMFPRRVFLGLGLGEAMNEVPLGYEWADIPSRIEKFEEALKMIRLLWTGRFVNFKGKYFTLDGARIYTLPRYPVPIIVATNNARVAEIAGKYADGFYTIVSDPQRLERELFPALERGAKKAGRDPRKITKGIHMAGLSYGTPGEAFEAYKRWRGSFVKNVFAMRVYDPRKIEKLGVSVSKQQLEASLFISKDPDAYVRRARNFIDLGFDHIMLGSAGPDTRRFLRFIGSKVLPILRSELP